MKNFKINVVFLGMILAFCVCHIFLSNSTILNYIESSHAVCNTTQYLSKTNGVDFGRNSKHSYLPSEGGNIPFSIYTSRWDSVNSQYSITEYNSSFSKWKQDSVFHYEMDKTNSIPYIVLSSKEETDHPSFLNDLYNTTLYFNFNDQNGKSGNDAKLIILQPSVTVENAMQKGSISLRATPQSNASADDLTYMFALNLLPLTAEGWECPELTPSLSGGAGSEGNKQFLGGNEEDNDVEYRTGLYSFNIGFTYQLMNGTTSSFCVFKAYFYVIDYSTYTVDKMGNVQNPITIKNVDPYVPLQGDSFPEKYFMYNYNYKDSPVINYDATKFGLNFTFDIKDKIYSFKHVKFEQREPDNGRNGIITLSCPGIGNAQYFIYTHDDERTGIKYLAEFDFEDFERNFIISHAEKLRTFSFQGIYSFDMDILIKSEGENFVTVDKQLFKDFPAILRNLDNYRLLIYGYDIRYEDRDSLSPTYQKFLPLKNAYTRPTFFAYNDSSVSNAQILEGTTKPAKPGDPGIYFELPEKIATTNQAPLQFHSFGNLKTNETQSQAKFTMLDSSYHENYENFKTNLTDVITEATTDSEFDYATLSDQIDTTALTNPLTYYQTSEINASGVYLMRLEYSVTFPVTNIEKPDTMEEKNINGVQYIIFKIESNVEKLYFHAKDDDNLYDIGNFTNKDILVSKEESLNCFYARTRVTYRFSKTYDSQVTTEYGELFLNEGENGTYVLGDKTFRYFLSPSSQSATFYKNGLYEVTISDVIGIYNTRSMSYTIKIDKNPFFVGVTEVTEDQGSFIVSGNAPFKYSEGNFNFYLTSSIFALNWEPKLSRVRDHLYICKMELQENVPPESFLIKQDTTYWLNNNHSFADVLLNTESNYVNPHGKKSFGGESIFEDNGLYYFYLYDDAGNNISLTVLKDDTPSSFAQGKWSGEIENSEWTSTFDHEQNPNNLINDNMSIYFGTHKILKLPNIDEEKIVTIEDNSYEKKYDKVTGVLDENPKILSFNVYGKLKQALGTYISKMSGTDLFNLEAPLSSDYFIVLENTSISFSKTTPRDEVVISNQIYRKGRVSIYTDDVPEIELEGYSSVDTFPFRGEGTYTFSVMNENGVERIISIIMNFDAIKGTFYAYNYGSTDIIHINENSGTNLDILQFRYTIASNLSEENKLSSLKCDYYQFLFNPEEYNEQEQSNYPFSSQSVPILEFDSTKIDNSVGEHIIDNINTNNIQGQMEDRTRSGMYVITRTLKGTKYGVGGVPIVVGGVEVGEGGDYKSDGTPFFKLDSRVRTYVVYVDHNQIISEKVIQGSPSQKEVGDYINITLNSGKGNDEEWQFKDFLKYTSYQRELITNEVPVKINVPQSKYFYFSNLTSSRVFSQKDFATLHSKIEFRSPEGGIVTYVSDDVNNTTFMQTCTKLKSADNPNGDLIFSENGRYTLTIYDSTGYSQFIQNRYVTNINPITTKEFVFIIDSIAPSCEFYSTVYSYTTKTFDTVPLTNDDGSNNFALNTKCENPSMHGEDAIDDNELFMTWEDPYSPYLSRINQISIKQNDDPDYFQIDMSNYKLEQCINSDNDLFNKTGKPPFLHSLKVYYYDETHPSTIFDNKSYTRYKYILKFKFNEESTYTITLHYKGDDHSSDVSYTLKIDRTKPNTNLDRLINGDPFLKSNYGNDLQALFRQFKEETLNMALFNTIPSTLTYAFYLSNNFSLSYDPNETLPYFYLRSFDPSIDHPSITPDLIGTEFFENGEIFGFYPKFSETTLINNKVTIGTNVWTQVRYKRGAYLYDLIREARGGSVPNGFYEIIEKDHAGNYRTFTVFFLAPNRRSCEFINFNGMSENSPNIDTTVYNNPQNDPLVYADDDIEVTGFFQIKDLYTELGWSKIIIKNRTLNLSPIEVMLNPFDTLSQSMISKLDNYFQCVIDTEYVFTMLCSNKNAPDAPNSIRRSLTIVTNKEKARLSSPIVEEIPPEGNSGITYLLHLVSRSETTIFYLIKFTLSKFENGAWIEKLRLNSEQEVIENNPINIAGGTYRVTFKDNYNKEPYSYNIYVGEYQIQDDSKRYSYQYDVSYDKDNDIYYTGGNISVTYEANIFKVKVNGETISGTSKEYTAPDLATYNCKTFTLMSTASNKILGGTTSYRLEYFDIMDGSLQRSRNFVIYSKLPEVFLTNKDTRESIFYSNNEYVEQQTNAVVHVDWGKLTGSPYELLNDSSGNIVTSALLFMKKNNEEYNSGVAISRGEDIAGEGFYKLVLRNNVLGNYRAIYFIISFKEASLYSVFTEKNGVRKMVPNSKWEHLDLSLNAIQTEPDNTSQNYYEKDPLIKYIYESLIDIKNRGSNSLQNKVERNKTEYDILVESMGYNVDSGIFERRNVGTANVLDVKHYYVTQNPIVTYNANMELNIIEFAFKNNELQHEYCFFKDPEVPDSIPTDIGKNFWTTIYLIYSLKGPIRIEFFAVTKVPETNNLLGDAIYFYGEKGDFSLANIQRIDLPDHPDEMILSNKQIHTNNIRLLWNALPPNKTEPNQYYWYNQGDYIFLSDKYGVSTYFDDLDVEKQPGTKYSYAIIDKSGEHCLQFHDLAGNKQVFQSTGMLGINHDYFMLYYIKKVIYNIRHNQKTLNPIQYAVFNENLSIVIDSINKKFQLYNISVSAYCNGNRLIKGSDYQVSYNNMGEQIFTFYEAGKYVVTISAKQGDTFLEDAVYNFTLIPSNSARLAFEFPKIEGYEITQVVRNGLDITKNFMDEERHIPSLFIASNESNSGNGSYQIVLKYGKHDEDSLSFTLNINDFTPTISCNIPYGETSNRDIVISYNPNFIYSQLGECYLKVLAFNNDTNRFYVYDTVPINSKSGRGASYTLKAAKSYCIQVNTISGNTVSSFVVNRVEPLNSFAIIIIVVSVVALAVLIFVIAKLRMRMKVR